MRNRWTMLAVLFLARTAMSVQFQSVGSLSPFLVPDLGLDYAALGTLIGLYMLPGLVIALPGGVLGRRFGETRMCLLGLALMTLGGLLMGLAETYALATIGGVIINVLLTKMVADWFAGPEMMTAMALFVISWPVGIGLGLLTLGPLAATTGWPLVMHVTAAICAISLVLVALCYHPPAGAAKPTGAGSLASMFRLGFTGRELALVLLAGTLWSLFNVSFILVVSFAPDFLTAAGHSQTDAGAVVSIATWLTVIMGPVGGLLAERSGRPGMILAVSLTRFGAAVAAMTVWDAPIPSFAIMGIIGGLAPGIIMALPARVVRSEVLAPAMGLYFTCYYAGMALLPAAAGWIRDAAGQADAPLLLAAGILFTALLTFLVFARLARN